MTLTIQEAINTIIAGVTSHPFPNTVDTVKLGDASQPLTGIMLTFITSYAVIEQAKQLNANLIITHEPTFYGHLDQTDWLQNNSVYQAKRQAIESNNLVVWRFHDYMHSIAPDPVTVGLIQALDWQSHPDYPVCQIPEMSLGDLVQYVKAKLNIPTLRIVGDLDMQCRSVALLAGFPPAQVHIEVLSQDSVDVLLCGEIHEWETSEYTRDAIALKQNKALIVTGHAASEEAGIKGVVPWLQDRLPDVPIHFVPTSSPFQYL